MNKIGHRRYLSMMVGQLVWGGAPPGHEDRLEDFTPGNVVSGNLVHAPDDKPSFWNPLGRVVDGYLVTRVAARETSLTGEVPHEVGEGNGLYWRYFEVLAEGIFIGRRRRR